MSGPRFLPRTDSERAALILLLLEMVGAEGVRSGEAAQFIGRSESVACEILSALRREGKAVLVSGYLNARFFLWCQPAHAVEIAGRMGAARIQCAAAAEAARMEGHDDPFLSPPIHRWVPVGAWQGQTDLGPASIFRAGAAA